jgi:hypothetical protein
MFEEIPPRPPAPSRRLAVASFAIWCGVSLLASVILWLRFGIPTSAKGIVRTGTLLAGSLLSGFFLLTAKSVSDETNRIRITVLVVVISALQLVDAVFQ